MRVHFLLLLILATIEAPAQDPHATLSGGIVTYTTRTGTRTRMQVGAKCSDLWASPDGAAITFIGIEKETPAAPGEIGTFVERSTVYVALRSDDFKAVAVPASPMIEGRVWHVAREPKVSPDLKSVYFLVPSFMTSLQLTRTAVSGRRYEPIADVSDYCIIWGGDYSGDLVILTSRDQQVGGVMTYPCYWRQRSGFQVEIAAECAASFEAIAARWAREHGGLCR